MKLSTWSCLKIRMQDEVIIYRLIIASLKGWKSSNIWEQPYKQTNSVSLVRERTIPTERPPLVGEVGANFCG